MRRRPRRGPEEAGWAEGGDRSRVLGEQTLCSAVLSAPLFLRPLRLDPRGQCPGGEKKLTRLTLQLGPLPTMWQGSLFLAVGCSPLVDAEFFSSPSRNPRDLPLPPGAPGKPLCPPALHFCVDTHVLLNWCVCWLSLPSAGVPGHCHGATSSGLWAAGQGQDPDPCDAVRGRRGSPAVLTGPYVSPFLL